MLIIVYVFVYCCCRPNVSMQQKPEICLTREVTVPYACYWAFNMGKMDSIVQLVEVWYMCLSQ